MFFVVKQKNFRRLFLLLLALCTLLLCGILHEKEDLSQPASSVPVGGKVITLDAGHGGFDAGASANGVTEKDINLDVTLRLREYLEQAGGIVFLTRSEDASTAEADKSGVAAKKSDLLARRELAKSSGSEIFVSIHMNKFSQEQYKGAQVFYAAKSEDSKRLGDTIQESLKEILADGNTRIAKEIDRKVLILKDADIPSVIVECGFLSNPEEVALLQEDSYRQKLAWGIYLGIVRYFNQ